MSNRPTGSIPGGSTRRSPTRSTSPDGVPGERPFDRSFLFNSQNVNKLSCILNLKTEEGRQTLRRLVAVADVLICNFRPGTLAKLGLDYEKPAQDQAGHHRRRTAGLRP